MHKDTNIRTSVLVGEEIEHIAVFMRVILDDIHVSLWFSVTGQVEARGTARNLVKKGEIVILAHFLNMDHVVVRRVSIHRNVMNSWRSHVGPLRALETTEEESGEGRRSCHESRL